MIWTAYGPPEVLQLREVAPPSLGDGDVLIRVRATAVAAGDCELRALRFSFGLRVLTRLMMGVVRPRNKILGQEFAGDIVAVGARVTRFRPGDTVFGTTGFGFGAYAEYLCLRENSPDASLAIKPDRMTYEEAATVPTGGLEALHLLRRTRELRGRSVLINGGGGGIGMLAIQIVKALGAEVTAVDTTRKLALMRQLGADRVIDFTQQNVWAGVGAYDVIFDVVGSARTSDWMGALKPGGYYLNGNPGLASMVGGPFTAFFTGTKVITRPARPRPGDFEYLSRLIESGKIRAVIDRSYPLDQLPAAHRFVDSGSAIGRVIITF